MYRTQVVWLDADALYVSKDLVRSWETVIKSV